MWPLKSILYFAVFWLGCAAALFNPIFGVVNYMLVYLVNPNNTWWGRPLSDLGMRLSLLAAGFTVVGLFTARKRVPSVGSTMSRWELCVLALVAIAGISLFTGVTYTSATRATFEKFWKVLLFVLILARLATTRRNLRMVLWTLVIGSLYLGHVAFTAPSSSFVKGRLDVIGGPDFSTTSGAGAHFVAMLPIIGSAFLITRSWKWKLLAVVSGALTVNAMVLCRTRSAFVGLTCGAIAAILLAPRVRRYRIHLLLIVGSLAAFSLTDSYFWERMATLTNKETLDNDAATVTRKEVWLASFHILADHPLGIGPGNFPSVIGAYAPGHHKRAAHNSLIACFVELGVQGGVVFLMMIVGSVVLVYRSSRIAHLSDDPVETKILAYGFFISFVTYFITALGTQRFYCESFWWVLVLPLCLHRMNTREAQARQLLPESAHSAKAGRSELITGELCHGM